MRFHSRYPLLQLWSGEGWAIVDASTLSVARLEPVVGDSVSGGAVLDLIFTDVDRVAVIPFLRIDPYSVVQVERTPMIWPSAARALGLEKLRAIEQQVLPWLRSLALARQQNDEAVRIFSGENHQSLYEAARSAGFLGATRYDALMPAFAPYVYAARFSPERSIGIVDDCGANGAAMLRARAMDVRADLRSAERNALAAQWFGATIFGDITGPFDVVVAPIETSVQPRLVQIDLDAEADNARVVSVASSVPLDVLVSFDPEDAPVARTFSVRSNLRRDTRGLTSAPVQTAAGGSSGSILLLMREDFERAPNADVEEATLLATRLRGEGFSVDVRAPLDVTDTYHADLVHAFALSGEPTEILLRRLHERGVPIVANPNLGAAPQESVWGPEILAAVYARAMDDAILADHLDLVRLRKLSTDVSTPAAKPVPALAYVDVVLVASEAERTHLCDVLRFRAESVPYAPVFSGDIRPSADIASLVGAAPFVFAHAPVGWRTNIPMLATAAAQHRVPLVIAGPLVDFACLRYAAQIAPELIIYLPSVDEAELDALYRSAHVFADVAWGPQGLQRLARAVASGCRLLVSQASWAKSIWDGAVSADPGSAESMAAALERAWSAAAAPAPRSGADLFSASIFAYSRAIAARQPA